MKKGLFWEKDANKISAIIDAFDQLSDNSYIWVTNLVYRKNARAFQSAGSDYPGF